METLVFLWRVWKCLGSLLGALPTSQAVTSENPNVRDWTDSMHYCQASCPLSASEDHTHLSSVMSHVLRHHGRHLGKGGAVNPTHLWLIPGGSSFLKSALAQRRK